MKLPQEPFTLDVLTICLSWSRSVRTNGPIQFISIYFYSTKWQKNHLRCVWKHARSRVPPQCCAGLTHSYRKQLWRSTLAPKASSWLLILQKITFSELQCATYLPNKIQFGLVGWLYGWNMLCIEICTHCPQQSECSHSHRLCSCPCGHCWWHCGAWSRHPGRLQSNKKDRMKYLSGVAHSVCWLLFAFMFSWIS